MSVKKETRTVECVAEQKSEKRRDSVRQGVCYWSGCSCLLGDGSVGSSERFTRTVVVKGWWVGA